MHFAAHAVAALIALLHIYILILEMFLWDKPAGLKAFRNTPERAADTKVMAANQGLYNGFLAAGLLLGPLARRTARPRGPDLLPAVRAGGRALRRRHGGPQDPVHPGSAGRAGPGIALDLAVMSQ